jgi:molybdate transport system substrate-binding protein
MLRIFLLRCSLLLGLSIGFLPQAAIAQKITIAAASDLKFAMDEIVTAYKQANPAKSVDVVYGSSGNFYTQIKQGAPYDLFFSADIDLPQKLVQSGDAGPNVTPYGLGRLVIWSKRHDARNLSLADLIQPKFAKIAIANPAHAPYGKRSQEAMEKLGVWERARPRIVMGENVTQAALFVETGSADVGVVALALVLNPKLKEQGAYSLVPENLHQPLNQGFVITKRAAGNANAKQFSDYMAQPATRAIMIRYGLALPGEAKAITKPAEPLVDRPHRVGQPGRY